MVDPNTWVDYDDILKLTGITAESVFTLGKIETEIFGIPITFHLVPNEFPIKRDGILGSKFLEDNFADVCYSQKCLKLKDKLIKFEHEETILVSPRSRTRFYVRVANLDVKIGYVKQLKYDEGIYVRRALVTNRNGKAYMVIINTTHREVEVAIPVVTLEPCRELSIGKINFGGDNKTPGIFCNGRRAYDNSCNGEEADNEFCTGRSAENDKPSYVRGNVKNSVRIVDNSAALISGIGTSPIISGNFIMSDNDSPSDSNPSRKNKEPGISSALDLDRPRADKKIRINVSNKKLTVRNNQQINSRRLITINNELIMNTREDDSIDYKVLINNESSEKIFENNDKNNKLINSWKLVNKEKVVGELNENKSRDSYVTKFDVLCHNVDIDDKRLIEKGINTESNEQMWLHKNFSRELSNDTDIYCKLLSKKEVDKGSSEEIIANDSNRDELINKLRLTDNNNEVVGDLSGNNVDEERNNLENDINDKLLVRNNIDDGSNNDFCDNNDFFNNVNTDDKSLIRNNIDSGNNNDFCNNVESDRGRNNDFCNNVDTNRELLIGNNTDSGGNDNSCNNVDIDSGNKTDLCNSIDVDDELLIENNTDRNNNDICNNVNIDDEVLGKNDTDNESNNDQTLSNKDSCRELSNKGEINNKLLDENDISSGSNNDQMLLSKDSCRELNNYNAFENLLMNNDFNNENNNKNVLINNDFCYEPDNNGEFVNEIWINNEISNENVLVVNNLSNYDDISKNDLYKELGNVVDKNVGNDSINDNNLSKFDARLGGYNVGNSLINNNFIDDSVNSKVNNKLFNVDKNSINNDDKADKILIHNTDDFKTNIDADENKSIRLNKISNLTITNVHDNHNLYKTNVFEQNLLTSYDVIKIEYYNSNESIYISFGELNNVENGDSSNVVASEPTHENAVGSWVEQNVIIENIGNGHQSNTKEKIISESSMGKILNSFSRSCPCDLIEALYQQHIRPRGRPYNFYLPHLSLSKPVLMRIGSKAEDFPKTEQREYSWKTTEYMISECTKNIEKSKSRDEGTRRISERSLLIQIKNFQFAEKAITHWGRKLHLAIIMDFKEGLSWIRNYNFSSRVLDQFNLRIKSTTEVEIVNDEVWVQSRTLLKIWPTKWV
ncbi:hypothetical protein KQX54_001510 [Cotesia glomerata]|uniref:Uncharacterized protein n=1 Tax=Cotesia glomerata TaxID=32391 RepID=A0AAV7HQ76_COTGL|nr:hypothetical protein KQX54_001510 [Cotesia glomerata]